MITKSKAILWLFTALLLGASQRSNAAVFFIPDGDVAALSDAINVANNNGEEDTIELAPNGNYTLLEPAELCIRTGLPYLGPDAGGTLTIHGNGAHISRSSGNPNNFRIFEMSYGNFAFSDLVISGGSAVEMDPCWGNPMGGAIFMYYATLTVTRCVFENNTASNGGGAIYDWGGSLTAEYCTFAGNRSTYGGGGAILTESLSNLTVIHCMFSNNFAGIGGAISMYGHRGPQQNTAIVSDSTLTGNSASLWGGAISIEGNITSRISHSTVNGNTAGSCAGIYNSGFGVADLTVEDCTISGNSASNGSGGAICNMGSNDGTTTVNTILRVTSSTISGNLASVHGGGIYNERNTIGSNGASATVSNTILKSGGGENLYNSGGTMTSQGYNLSDDNGSGLLTGPGDQINTDPMLDPAGLQNNGGPTQTIALLPGSPAINSGDSNAPVRDQRYYVRNGLPDKGAFEYNGELAPTSVVSRKAHGAAGTFDVDLQFGGIAGLECRTGGAGGNHQVIATFATPVTIGSASVTTGIGSVSNASVNGSQVTLDLTGISNAQQIVLTVSGANDGANTNNVIIPMRVLLGDTTGNIIVNASDVSQTKAQVGQALTNSNFRNDVNANGTINASDVTQVKSQVGMAVPIPLESAEDVRNLKAVR